MKDEEEFNVTSEILPFFDRDTSTKPRLSGKNVISRLKFSLPIAKSGKEQLKLEKDEDGDYILQRKNSQDMVEKVIVLEHSISTGIKLVGLQLWRAALLLADFVIHYQEQFVGKTVLELGSGIGLTSIVAGMFASHIICTDLDQGQLLQLIKLNLNQNKELLKAHVQVNELDFFNLDWSTDLNEMVESTDIVLAADVIYDNNVTEAFVRTITKILSTSPRKTFYLGLEKRYVFTISDLDSVAPCFEHFKSCLESAQSKPPFSQWKVCELPIDFPQYFNYERTKQLVLFKFSS